MTTTRRAPDTSKAREALHHALRLLDDQEDPLALDNARDAAQRAVDAIPYRWRHPYCSQRRRNLREDTCGHRTCTRCTALEAGDPMPADDW